MTTAPLPAETTVRGGNRRGRPKMLERDRIVAATLDMLAQESVSSFTLAKLAQRLGVSTMTLYTYFPSREALLGEVASTIFGTFRAPPAGIPWREGVIAWLDELHRIVDLYPMALWLIKGGGAIAPSWLSALSPLARILASTGLSDRQVMITLNWVTRISMALLLARDAIREEGMAVHDLLIRSHDMPEADRAVLIGLADDDEDGGAEELYEFGIRNLLLGLDDAVARANGAV